MGFIEKLDKLVYWSLCGYALTFSVSVGAANIFLVLSVLIAIVRTIKKRPYFSIPIEYGRAILVFLGTLLCLTIFSPDFVVAIKRVWEFTDRIIPFLLIVACIKERQQIIRVVALMFISISITDVVAIWQGLHGNFRAAGFGGHIIDFAGSLVQLIPILVIAIMDKNFKQKRKYLWMVLLISSIALLFNGTRGVWLALAVVIPISAFMYYGTIKKSLLYIVIVAAVVGIIVQSVPALQARVASIPDPSHASNKERVLIWNSAWKMFKDHPITGVGLNQYTHKYQTEYISPVARERTLTHAHNNFLQMLAENGIIGFLAFCFMFGSFLFYSVKDWLKYHDTSTLMFFTITSAILLQGLTDFNFGLTKMMQLYFCLMVMYLRYRYNDIKYV